MSSTRSFHRFHFSTAEKKTMERVIGLESIVETKDLAVSQTKSHILRQNKLGFSWYRDNSNIMSNTTHDKYVFCMLYVCIYIYIYRHRLSNWWLRLEWYLVHVNPIPKSRHMMMLLQKTMTPWKKLVETNNGNLTTRAGQDSNGGNVPSLKLQ